MLEQTIVLPYGKQQISFWLPGENLLGVYNPQEVAACADPALEIDHALDHPLGSSRIEDGIRPGESALILIDDYTRGTPVQIILPAILKRLESAGCRAEDISLLVATGTHRPSSDDEMREKLGDELYSQMRIAQHDCTDQGSQTFLGLTSRGTPVWVNQRLTQADHIYGIGHIDPSDFAGYAGGEKLIVPGVAALETVDANHSLATLSFRKYGSVDLPCRQDINEAGGKVRVDLFINVVLNREGQIARAFAGAPSAVHAAGVAVARQVYEVQVPVLVDAVVASAFPYDVDFYQAIRALEYADLITRPGGGILLVAPCSDGLGSEVFFQLLAEPDREPHHFLRNIAQRRGKVTYNALGYFLANIRKEKRVYGYMPGIPPHEQQAIGITPVDTLQAGVDRLIKEYGPQMKTAVLPVGSATIPRLTSPARDS